MQQCANPIALILRRLPDAQVLESIDAHARSVRTLLADLQPFDWILGPRTGDGPRTKDGLRTKYQARLSLLRQPEQIFEVDVRLRLSGR